MSDIGIIITYVIQKTPEVIGILINAKIIVIIRYN